MHSMVAQARTRNSPSPPEKHISSEGKATLPMKRIPSCFTIFQFQDLSLILEATSSTLCKLLVYVRLILMPRGRALPPNSSKANAKNDNPCHPSYTQNALQMQA